MKQKHIENIFTHLGDAVLMVNEASEIIYGNDAFFKTFGYSTEEIIGQSLDLLVDTKDRAPDHTQLVKRFLYSDSPPIPSMARRPIQCIDNSGNRSPFNISLSRIQSGNNVIGVAILHDATKIEDEREAYQQLVRTDELTGLYNRRYFDELMEDSNPVFNSSDKVGIIYIDLDKFKSINDEYGHEAGDDTLKIISKRIKNSIRNTDIACRLGGDEFVVFALDIKSRDDLKHLSQHLHHSISQAPRASSLPFRLDASIGACLYPDDGSDIRMLVGLADQKMYSAKRNQSRILA